MSIARSPGSESLLPVPAPRAQGLSRDTSSPLYWREDGPPTAPAVVLLHGGPGAHHDYLYPQCLALAAAHRLFTYDQRGGGRSRTDDPAPITWRTHVDDLARIVTEFDLRPFTLAGYSWGALLAICYVIEASRTEGMTMPERLVLVSPAPITRSWRAEFESALVARQQGDVIQRMRAELNASGLRERDPSAFRHRSFELSVAGYFADPGRASSLTPFRVTARVQQSVWDSLGDYDFRSALRAVHVPTLVVHGRQDPIPLASAEAAAAALDAQFVALDECGHVPYVEQPAALFAAIDAFLATAKPLSQHVTSFRST